MPPTNATRASAALLAATLACSPIADPGNATGIRKLDVPASAPADGATLVRIAVAVDPALDRGKRGVALHTSAGLFEGKNDLAITADASDTAVAYLTATSDSGNAIVTATLGTTTVRAP